MTFRSTNNTKFAVFVNSSKNTMKNLIFAYTHLCYNFQNQGNTTNAWWKWRKTGIVNKLKFLSVFNKMYEITGNINHS